MTETLGPELLTSLVAGGWTSPGGDTYPLRNPATGAEIATVTRASTGDVDQAVTGANDAFARLRHAPLRDRVAWCEATAEVIESRADDLAIDLVAEHGKPLAEGRAEIGMGIRGFRLAAESARRLDGYMPPTDDPNKRVMVIRQPRGVWALATPWNFPFNIPIEYLGPALATASPFVWKPAPTTARIAVRLAECMLEAGVPAGMVNLILTDEVPVAAHVTAHPGVAAVGLTGGAKTGQAVAQAAWDKHLLLELGGNGPMIVCDDADMDVVVPAVAASTFTNAGQVCSAAGRILAAEGVADHLAQGVGELANDVVVGAPDAPDTRMGPVHAGSVATMVERHVADAVDRGASVVTGGSRIDTMPTELFYEPTVLDRVPLEATINREETFGPVAPITRVAGDDAIIEAANRSSYGLVATVFTQSLPRAFRLAEALESGTVIVNDQSNYWELQLPFGGWQGKDSGRGRVGGRHALEEFTQLKTISLDING